MRPLDDWPLTLPMHGNVASALLRDTAWPETSSECGPQPEDTADQHDPRVPTFVSHTPQPNVAAAPSCPHAGSDLASCGRDTARAGSQRPTACREDSERAARTASDTLRASSGGRVPVYLLDSEHRGIPEHLGPHLDRYPVTFRNVTRIQRAPLPEPPYLYRVMTQGGPAWVLRAREVLCLGVAESVPVPDSCRACDRAGGSRTGREPGRRSRRR